MIERRPFFVQYEITAKFQTALDAPALGATVVVGSVQNNELFYTNTSLDMYVQCVTLAWIIFVVQLCI